MSLLTILKNTIGKLFGLWQDLSPELKAAIISAIVKGFEELFRKYYRDYHSQDEEESNSKDKGGQNA